MSFKSPHMGLNAVTQGHVFPSPGAAHLRQVLWAPGPAHGDRTQRVARRRVGRAVSGGLGLGFRAMARTPPENVFCCFCVFPGGRAGTVRGGPGSEAGAQRGQGLADAVARARGEVHPGLSVRGGPRTAGRSEVRPGAQEPRAASAEGSRLPMVSGKEPPPK